MCVLGSENQEILTQTQQRNFQQVMEMADQYGCTNLVLVRASCTLEQAWASYNTILHKSVMHISAWLLNLILW